MTGQVSSVYDWANRRTRKEALRMLRTRFFVTAVTYEDASAAERDPQKWKEEHKPLDLEAAGL